MTDPPPTSNDSSAPRRFKCAIDRTILDEDTVSDLTDIGQSIFAPLCGKNRGAFVLDPPDGQTYGCVAFPQNFAQLAGLTASNGTAIPDISDSNAIVLQFQAGNLTASDAVDLLDLYAQLVYNSTADVEKLPYGCDAGGLAVLECGDEHRPSPMEGGGPIRAATLAGVFVPAPWATGGDILTLDEARGFYTAKDFDEMREFGLNAVQIPVPLDAFLVGADVAPHPPPVEVETPDDAPAASSSSVALVEEGAKDEDMPNSPVLGKHSPPSPPTNDDVEAGGEEQTEPSSTSVQSVLEDVLNMVSGAGLRAIIVLVGNGDGDTDETKAIEAASTFAASRGDAVLALTLPSASGDVVAAARAAPGASNLPLFLPVNGGDLLDLTAGDDPNVYASLDMEHSSTVADVASSTSVDDRMKMFYHEATACTTRSPIEYAGCYRGVPAFVSGGFDLSVDDCAMKVEKAADFRDYGQCDRFDETVGSPWWERHRSSFAARQVSSYERGLGWSYTAWKLYDGGDDVETGTGGSGSGGVTDAAMGALDTPAKLLCLRDVAAAGLMPPLSVNGTDVPSSPAAPLACLNPPVSDFILGDATLAPTPGPPPDCGNGWWNASTGKCDYWVPPPPVPCKPSKKGIGTAASVGAVVGFVVGAVAVKACGIGKRSGYSSLPLS